MTLLSRRLAACKLTLISLQIIFYESIRQSPTHNRARPSSPRAPNDPTPPCFSSADLPPAPAPAPAPDTTEAISESKTGQLKTLQVQVPNLPAGSTFLAHLDGMQYELTVPHGAIPGELMTQIVHPAIAPPTTVPAALFDLEAALLASQESYSDTAADLDNVLKASEKEESESAAERAAAGARLNANLEPWGLEEEDVPGDNNCLFHALVLQLGRVGLYAGDAKSLRESLVAWMSTNPDFKIDEAGAQGEAASLKDFVGSDEQWEAYLLKMGAHGKQWGDHLVLVAASEVYRVPIMIFSSAIGNNQTPLKIAPSSRAEVDEGKTIYLGHYMEQHYVSTRSRAVDPSDGTAACTRGRSWVCSVCTVVNDKADAPVCGLCGAARTDNSKALRRDMRPDERPDAETWMSANDEPLPVPKLTPPAPAPAPDTTEATSESKTEAPALGTEKPLMQLINELKKSTGVDVTKPSDAMIAILGAARHPASRRTQLERAGSCRSQGTEYFHIHVFCRH